MYLTNIKTHLDRKNKCIKRICVFGKSDKELYDNSLIPQYDNELFYTYNDCNKKYSRKDSYKRHIDNNKCKKSNTIEINESNLTNSTINLENNINNINITVIPFT